MVDVKQEEIENELLAWFENRYFGDDDPTIESCQQIIDDPNTSPAIRECAKLVMKDLRLDTYVEDRPPGPGWYHVKMRSFVYYEPSTGQIFDGSGHQVGTADDVDGWGPRDIDLVDTKEALSAAMAFLDKFPGVASVGAPNPVSFVADVGLEYGLDRDVWVEKVQAWNRAKNSSPLSDEEVEQIVSRAYADKADLFFLNDPPTRPQIQSLIKSLERFEVRSVRAPSHAAAESLLNELKKRVSVPINSCATPVPSGVFLTIRGLPHFAEPRPPAP